ncbi:MAG: thymidine phosphorylase family protein, partial [archaeon]
TKGVKEGEIGFFEEAMKKVGAKGRVDVDIADQPRSIEYIKRKLHGEELNAEEYDELVKDIVHDEFSDVELTYFVSGCYAKGLNMDEAVSLTNAIVNNGEKFKFNKGVVVDKHCIGGVPGNRTTMVVVPIIASLGYKMPKTSSRSITSPSGTADTMEVVAPVKLSADKIKKIVNKHNGVIAWGGGVNLAAADDKLIRIRHPMSLDPLGMMLASIMAKKKAVGSTHVLIDIPYGKGAKVEKKNDALKLKELFIAMGKKLNIKIKVVLTDGSQPIGSGIGPALEVADVIAVLKGNGPNDLREKSIFLATEMLKMLDVKNPKEKVLEILESGKAYSKFREIIVAQGGKKRPHVPKASLFYEYKATSNGKVKEIHNKEISKLARIAGAPDDKTAGLYLRVRRNNKIKKGEILFTLYAESKMKLETAITYLKTIKPIDY